MKSSFLRFFICLFVLSFFGGMPGVNAQTDPALLFAKGIGNEFFYGGDLIVQGIKIDASGNRYVTGYFSGTADFDPGEGIDTLTSTRRSDIFLAKYNASGNYVWAHHMGGSSDDQATSLALDGSGHVVITGSFNTTVDFDPGAGTANLTSVGNTDIFIAKYDTSGNYVWANQMGGSAADVGTSLALDGSGNVVVTGYFSSGTSIDFDPGANSVSLTSAGVADIFLAKYDASGNYVWVKEIGGTGDDRGLSLALDGSGNAVVTGYFNGTTAIDFDPGTGTATLTGAGSTDIFLAKYSALGVYTWAERMGGTGADQGNSLALDGSGNVVVTGYFNGTTAIDFDPGAGTATLTGAGGTDIFLAKYSSLGVYTWAEHMGGTGADVGNSLALDGSGNVMLTGYFNGTADVDPGTNVVNLVSAGGNDIFLAKYSALGVYTWSERMGGTGADQGYSLALDGSTNVVVTGNFTGTVDFDPGASTTNLVAGSTFKNGFIASYTAAAGSFNSALLLGKNPTASNVISNAIVKDGSGNLYITGSFEGTVDFDPGTGTAELVSAGGTDIFIAKYTASGNYIWAKAMGGTDADQGNSLAVDGSGNVVVTGYFSLTADFDPGAGTVNHTSGGSTDLFIAKYDASGNYVWANTVSGGFTDKGNSLALDSSGNVVVTGYMHSSTGGLDFDPGPGTAILSPQGSVEMFLVKYDASGNYVWVKEIGGGNAANVQGNSLAVDGSGNVVVTGNFNGTSDFDPGTGTANLTSTSNYTTMFLAKYDASGNYIWVKTIVGVGTSASQGNSLALDGSGNVVVTGYFTSTADFDPGAGTANLTSAGGYDLFIAKYDASGKYVWAKAMGGTGTDWGFSLALDGSGYVLVTGYFYGTSDFDPGPCTASIVGSLLYQNSIFLAKYDASGNYVWAKVIGPGNGMDQGNSLVVDGSGNVVVTGYFNGTKDFDIGAGTYNLTSMSSGQYGFIAAYTSPNSSCINPTAGGTIAAAQSGYNPFTPAAFTSSAAASGQTGTIEYKWESSTTSNSAGFTDIASSNSDTYTPGALTQTTWFKRLARVDCKCDWIGAAESNVLQVTVAACINPTAGGTIAAAQSGYNPFTPAAFTSTVAASGQTGSVEYKWESSTTSSSAGFADIASSNSATYTAGALTQTTWFKRLARVPCKTDWIGAVESNVIEVTVAPCNNPTVGGTIAAAQSGINPFTPAAFTSTVAASGQTGTIEYKWESSTTSASAGFADIASSNAATYTPGALTVTTWFKRLARASCKSDWTGAAESNVLEVTVTSCINPTIGGTIAAAQSGINPFTPTAFTSSVAASGQTGTLEYKWQSSTTSNSAGFADIASSNAATYTPGTLTVTTWFKRLARVSCSGAWSGASESNVLEVTVTNCINPTAGGTIAAAQSGYNPFTPAAFTSSAAASGQSGTLEYKWQSSTTSNSAGFADIASSNAATYTPGALTVTTWFKRLARVSCKSDWTGAAESNVLAVTVTNCINPTAGGTIAAAQSGTNPFTPAAFTSSAAASGQTGTLEYKWQSSTTSNSAGFADIASSNAATYTAGTLTVTTWFKRLARVSCKSDWTGAAESNVLEVTLTAACTNPTDGGTIAAAQSGINPFTPAAFTSSVAASGQTGTLEYKWQSSTTSNSAGFADIASSNAVTYTPGALTVTTWFKRLARVTCSGDWSGAAESNVLEVTVTSCTNPTAGGTIAAAQSGISPFDPAAFTSSSAASGETGTMEYKWQSSTTSNSTGFSDIASSNAATYNAGSLTQTTWFKRLARVSCKSDWTGAAESNVLEVTVIVLDPEPLAQPTNLFFTNSGASAPYDINLNYTASATAAGYLVVRKTFAAPSFVPADGSTYSAGAQGSDTILYVGSATSVADLAVNNLVDYHYRIYAFNGSGATINYLTVNPLGGKAIVKPSNSEPVASTSQSVSAGFPGAGVNITFPNGTPGSTITAAKTNSAPAANFSVLPGVRGVVNQYFTITSTNASAGTYMLTLDFSGLGLSPTSWASFKILKRADATAPWVDIINLGATILNRQTDGVWGKFTITGLSSFSDFTGGAEAVTTTVITTAETGPGSLKQAILDATAGDFINFDTTRMGGKTITLTSPVVINKDLTIIGANGGITLNGSHATRVMDISDAVVVRLDRLKIENGIGNVGLAGGIWNNGNLTMVNCVVSGNAEIGEYGVGGILQYSAAGTDNPDDVLNLINCTVTGNTGFAYVNDNGIGGLSVPNGTANIYNTIIYGNTGDASSDVDITTAITLVDHSDIGNLDSLTVTTNTANISSDPGFAGAANAAHPFAITGSSPAADAGSNSACLETTDIRGGSFGRKLNKTDGTAGIIDMGAYEFSVCINPTSGGVIAAAQSGVTPFNPAAFTSTSAATGQTGTLEYKWQLSTTSASAGFSDIASSNAATYDAGALTATTWYKRLARVTCSADWTGAAESNVLEATVTTINTWTGTTNNNFNTGTNWSLGTVPTASENFTITTGHPQLNVDYTVGGTMTISGTGGLTINAGKTLSVGALGTADFGGKSVTIKSDAAGTGAIGQIAGTLTGATNVTVERYIATAKRAWRFLTVPVTGQTLRNAWAGASANATAPSGESAGSGTLITGHGIASGATASAAGFDWFAGLNTVTTSSIRYYSTAANWSSASNTPNLLVVPNKNGYMLFVRGDRTVTSGSGTTTLRPTGTLKTGTQTMAVNNAYEVIGNPYASSIDLDAVYNNSGNSAVINRNFWVWDATLGTSGAYRALSFNSTSYDMAGGSGSASDYLKVQSGQAFFVEMNNTGGNITIEEANKTGNASVNLMGTQPVSTVGKLAISLYQATGSTLTTEMDGVLARFGSAFQSAGTDDYDVAKISNFNENLGLLRGDRYLSIDSRPYPVKTDTLFAPFWNLTNRAYALKIGSTGIGGQMQGAKLVDAFTKTETALNLNEGGAMTYPFSVTADAASSSLDRFMIVMTAPTSLPVSFTSVNATPKTTGIDVTWKTGTEVNVKDYSVERSSDGLTFAAINSKTALNANNGAAYSWLDLQPLTGKNYYRIRSNDKGGDYHYSGIATANWNGKAGMGVYPTAVTQGQFTVQLSNQPAGTYKLALTTIAGRQVYGQSLSHAGGSGNYGVKTGSLAVSTGVYQLTITAPDGRQESFRLLISNK